MRTMSLIESIDAAKSRDNKECLWRDKSFERCVHDALCVPLNTERLIVIAQSLSFGFVGMLSPMYVQW